MRQPEGTSSTVASPSALASWIRRRFARWILSAPLEQTETGAGKVEDRLELLRGARVVIDYAFSGGGAGRPLPEAPLREASSWDAATSPTASLWVCRTGPGEGQPPEELLASRSCMLVDLRALRRADGLGAMILLGVEPELRAAMTLLPAMLRRLAGVPACRELRAIRDTVERGFQHHAFGGAVLLDAREDAVLPAATADAGADGGLAVGGFGRAWLSPGDDGGGAASTGISVPPPLTPRDLPELHFYEIVVVDELEAPVAGVKLTMTTPLGTVTKTTGADGLARVDDAPRGMGSVSVASTAAVRDAFTGREKGTRRMRPLPSVGDWVFRTLSRLGGAIPLPSGKRRRLMIVTRTDVYSAGDLPTWGDLRVADEGPWELLSRPDAGSVRLHVHADATGRTPKILGEAAEPSDFAPPDDERSSEPASLAPPEWSTMDTGTLHDALFDRNLDHALGLISALPVDPPADADTPPPPIVEGLLFAGNLASLAVEGQVDRPFDSPDEVLANPTKAPTLREVSHGAQNTRHVA